MPAQQVLLGTFGLQVAELAQVNEILIEDTSSGGTTLSDTPGRFLVFVCADASSRTIDILTDSFTVETSSTDTANGNRIATKIATGAESTVGLSFIGTTDATAGIYEFDNGALGGFGSDLGSSPDATIPSFTFPAGGGFILTAQAESSDNSASVTPPAGWTTVRNEILSGSRMYQGYKQVPAGASGAQFFDYSNASDIKYVWAFVVAG